MVTAARRVTDEGSTMAEPHVTLDPGGPGRVEPAAPSEEQLSCALRAATRLINKEYAGEPVEQVCRRLLDETRSGLHPDVADQFSPDMEEFCRVAVAIVRRNVHQER